MIAFSTGLLLFLDGPTSPGVPAILMALLLLMLLVPVLAMLSLKRFLVLKVNCITGAGGLDILLPQNQTPFPKKMASQQQPLFDS